MKMAWAVRCVSQTVLRKRDGSVFEFNQREQSPSTVPSSRTRFADSTAVTSAAKRGMLESLERRRERVRVAQRRSRAQRRATLETLQARVQVLTKALGDIMEQALSGV